MSILDRLRRFLGLTAVSPPAAKLSQKLATVPTSRGPLAGPITKGAPPSLQDPDAKLGRKPSVTLPVFSRELDPQPGPATPPKGLSPGTTTSPNLRGGSDPLSKQTLPTLTTVSSAAAASIPPPLPARKPQVTLPIFARDIDSPSGSTPSPNTPEIWAPMPAPPAPPPTDRPAVTPKPAPAPPISAAQPSSTARPPRPFKLPPLSGLGPKNNPQPDEAAPPSGSRSTNEPPLNLVMGIDFGTSCSKVVVGDPTWRNRAYAIRLNDSPEIAGYLHPTRWEDQSNLKMRLMQAPNDTTVRDAVACYIADLVKRTLAYFAEHGPTEYRNRELRWSLNIGFPRKSTNGNTELASAYKQIAQVALTMCSNKLSPSMSLAASLRMNGDFANSFIPNSRVDIYPEIAAQLAGYIKSPDRKFGSLLLVDVGAGTLDVSTIILHSADEQDIVSFHFCEVEDLGVLRLYQARCEALEKVQRGIVQNPIDSMKDASRAVPERLDQIIKKPTPRLVAAYDGASSKFHLDVLTVTMGCLTRFRMAQKKANINPGFQPWGKRHLRFFLTGGGSRSPFYIRCLVYRDGLEQRVANAFDCWELQEYRRKQLDQGFRIERLPVPSNLINFPQQLNPDFDRISVAYGLAYGDKNLMQITSNSDN